MMPALLMTALSCGKRSVACRAKAAIVARDELEAVAADMELPMIAPEWIGANMTLAGVPMLSMLPASTLLFFEGGAIDLVEDGQTWEEVVALATEIEAAGASIISTGIGWHEARVPTIVTSVPRGVFVDVTARLKQHVRIPVVASNRLTMPQLAEEVLASGAADLVSLADDLHVARVMRRGRWIG